MNRLCSGAAQTDQPSDGTDPPAKLRILFEVSDATNKLLIWEEVTSELTPDMVWPLRIQQLCDSAVEVIRRSTEWGKVEGRLVACNLHYVGWRHHQRSWQCSACNRITADPRDKAPCPGPAKGYT